MDNPFDQFDDPRPQHSDIKEAPAASPFDAFDPPKEPERMPAPTSVVPQDGATMGPRQEDGTLRGDSIASRVFRKVDDFVRAIGNGATFGLADKAAGALNGSQDKEAELSRQARIRSPVASVVGEGLGAAALGGPISEGVGMIAPALARKTIPAMMGNQALTGATLSAGDDIAHGNVPDPVKAAGSALIGGVAPAVISTTARVVSPTARVRAAGLDLTPEDKVAMTAAADRAKAIGVPITIPEAAGVAAPTRAGALEAAANNAASTPKGSEVWSNFEAGRPPLVAQAARDTAARVAAGAPDVGVPTQAAAKQAIQDAKNLVRNSAKLDYDAAGNATGFKLPRDENGNVLPAIQEAIKKVKKDPIVMGDLGKSPPNSISFMQAARDKMGKMYKKANSAGDNNTASLIADAKGQLSESMQTNPLFARGDATFGAGQRQLVDPLKTGPLGALSKTANPATQARSLMDIATPQGERQSMDAIARLNVNGNQPEGLMAARLQDMASRDPMAIGNKFMPTQESRNVAGAMTSPAKMADVDNLVTVLQSLKPKNVTPGGESGGGPWAEAWHAVRNMGSGKVAKLLQDPAMIPHLGELGGPERVLQLLATGMGGEVADEQMPRPLTIRKRRSER